MNNKKRATCFAIVLQNESVISHVAHFTTNENKSCDLTCCKTGSKMGGKYKTRNITIQLSMLTDPPFSPQSPSSA